MTVPSVDQEAARDLVRAREDAHGDLMGARHRLSKLLLRQGYVYSGGQAWTGVHDVWLRRTGAQLGSAATRMTFESDYDAVLTVKARRDRLDDAITVMAADCEFTPVLRRLGCLRGIGTLTGFALAVEVGEWERFSGKTSAPSPGWCRASTPRVSRVCRARSPRRETPTYGESWSKRPGTTGPATRLGRPCGTGGHWRDPPPEHVGTRATGGCTTGGSRYVPGTSATSWPTSRSPANWPAGAGPSASVSLATHGRGLHPTKQEAPVPPPVERAPHPALDSRCLHISCTRPGDFDTPGRVLT